MLSHIGVIGFPTTVPGVPKIFNLFSKDFLDEFFSDVISIFPGT